MDSVYDVQQLLMKFGIVVYIGDRLADLELMEAEIRELFSEKVISTEEFQQSILLLSREKRKMKEI